MIKFSGAIPALVTPLKEDESLNTEAFKKLMHDLLLQGADGFYVGGATGEGLLLSQQTREELAWESVNYLKGKSKTIIHVASTKFNEAIELAKHAERCGADAISAIPPIFFAYDEDDVYNYYKRLASAVHIPLMVYYSPMANFSISPQFAARLFDIENVTAIKWTSSDYYGMLRLKDLTNGEMNIINGADEMLLMGLNAGADGGIGTSYNIILPYIKAICDGFAEKNIEAAQKAQIKVNEVISVLLKYKVIPATKAVLENMGYAVGNSAFPMKRYSDEEKKEIFDLVKHIVFSSPMK